MSRPTKKFVEFRDKCEGHETHERNGRKSHGCYQDDSYNPAVCQEKDCTLFGEPFSQKGSKGAKA